MRTATSKIWADAMRLNAICPYFTMFPLDFPLGILEGQATNDECVLDPFCGRGTTNFAARLLGLESIGVDVSRVAVAATRSRLVASRPERVIDATRDILKRRRGEVDVPEGEFWRWAYHEKVLQDLCTLRAALLDGGIREPVAAALRGIILGALHGPVGRTKKSYFSNQFPRTYAPKPMYSVRYWSERKLRPPQVDVIDIIGERAQRYYGASPRRVQGTVVEGDSRNRHTLDRACRSTKRISYVITSPPYYGLKTYVPDQWIRNWFLGGPSTVEYTKTSQLSHHGRDDFIRGLREVWANVGQHCRQGANMVVRFGSIGDRPLEDPARFVVESLDGTGWSATGVRSADNAAYGKRQADTFRRKLANARDEVDVSAQWSP